MPWLCVNTEYSIHPRSTFFPSFSQDYELTPEYIFSFWLASLQIDRLQAALHVSSKVLVPCHIATVGT